MASSNAVWGIDIGQCALKAIKLRPAENGRVEAVAFDVIEHEKILSQPDADRDELIAAALQKFTSRNETQGDKCIVGVPGQQTFARFCKMPPIDLKKDARKIHDLVRYEASQQIPFDIEDVVWDYQIFTSEGSPDIEVGIFAIRKDLIRKHLGYFGNARIVPTGVQTIPAALYNFCRFDGQAAGDGAAAVIVDVGAQNTDLIIVESNSAWTRNIPLGGNSFTEALVRAFKLSFSKAESLKRGAADSKYARQIFQAMRPVFADLVAEIQRSIGFYSSTRREIELKKVLALGNAFRLPGLQKYLENNLTIAGGVTKLEKFSKLLPTAAISAPQFTENVLSFPAAYGLALQGLGLAEIRASLLPTELARVAVWQKKRPYFIATAAALGLAAGIPYMANGLDRQALDSEAARQARQNTQQIINEAKRFRSEYQSAQTDTGQREQDIQKLLKLQEHKDLVPRVVTLVHEAMPPINPPELADVKSVAEFKKLIESDPARYDRAKRGQLIVESLKVEYVRDLSSVSLGQEVSEEVGPTPMGGFGDGGGRGMGGMMGPGGRGGRGMAPGGGRGLAPGAAGPGPAAPAGEGISDKSGFVVRVRGRLLQGRTKAEAVAWLYQAYLENLRELGRRPGVGFYIPPDNPEKPSEASISQLNPRPYNQEAITGFSMTPPLPGQPTGETSGTRFPDPLTGEETAYDWVVEFSFKLKFGEPPPEEEKPAEGTSDTPSENQER